MERTPGSEPATVVVLGGVGDLMERKLLPALYRLAAGGLIHPHTLVVGASRRTLDDAGFRAWARKALAGAGLDGDDQAGRWCDDCLFFRSLHGGTLDDYRVLAARLAAIEQERHHPGNRVFYLSLPPQAIPGTVVGLGEAGLNRGAGWTRVVIEKPFGRDLGSSQALNQLVHRHFEERQIYRIDHYLGKETVQNLLVFRFANPIFETLWNRDRIESVQITVAEQVGIEGRVGYYEQAGALRDMVQSHLTQLLTLIAMEVPVAFEAAAVRNEKVKVLRSIAPIGPADAVLGQYTRGELDGSQVPGYREESGVASDSPVETFVALRLEIANWRWHGVSFYLRTGKRMPRRLTQVTVTFRRPPVSIFRSFENCEIHANTLGITIQPDEGFDLCFEVKAPGQQITLETQRLHFRYAEVFAPLPEAYETLLLDVLSGDQTLFVRADEVEEAWRLYAPVLEKPPQAHPYAAGTWGPGAADHLLARDGERWVPV